MCKTKLCTWLAHVVLSNDNNMHKKGNEYWSSWTEVKQNLIFVDQNSLDMCQKKLRLHFNFLKNQNNRIEL